MNERKAYIKSCEVSKLCAYTLGGYSQKVLIEGYKKDLPVVICLHGGPGSPVPFGEGCRGLFPEWSKKAVMVFWDQLGCGINNRELDDGFTTDSFADMTVDLIDKIRSEFPENKIYLFGVSWGSLLALKAAVRAPEKISGVIVWGQILKNLFFDNPDVLDAVSDIPEKPRNTALKILEEGKDIDGDALDKNLKTLYKILSKYTDAYSNKNAAPAPVGKIVKGILKSPDYTFKDFKAVMKNGYAKNRSLWRELLHSDYSPLLKEVKTPYVILYGETDFVASTRIAEEEIAKSGNPNITLKVLKNEGHMPSLGGFEECFKIMSEIVK